LSREHAETAQADEGEPNSPNHWTGIDTKLDRQFADLIKIWKLCPRRYAGVS
jgi:hypothetical protein